MNMLRIFDEFFTLKKKVSTSQFNCDGYNDDGLKSSFAFFPFFLILIAYLFTTVVNLGQIIEEKESKMKVNEFFF